MQNWFTPERRKAIYNVGVAVFALAVVAGWIAPEQVEKFQTALLTAGGLFAALTNLMASKNVSDQ
jgi:hypothetical membrane protein